MKQKIIIIAIFMFAFAQPNAASMSDINELDNSIRAASAYLNERVTRGDKVAIVSVRQNFPMLAEYIIENLIENAVNDRAFDVIDRAQLDAVRAELALQASGEVSDESVRSMGRILGAKTIITVTVSQVATMYRFSIRILDVESAEIRGQVSRNISSGQSVDILAGVEPSATQPSTSTQTSTSAQRTRNIQYGSFTDPRDNQRYRTVVMPDGKTWMADNLKYRNPNWSRNDVNTNVRIRPKDKGSWCYDNNASNCNTLGRLYTWNAAMEACPAGWRLPTNADWRTLTDTIGGMETAGTKLKTTTGWRSFSGIPRGTDQFGFSIQPVGGYWDGRFANRGFNSYLWSATENDATQAVFRVIHYGSESVVSGLVNKTFGVSVRCVRD